MTRSKKTTEALSIISSTPALGQSNIGINGAIQITFSESIDSNTLTLSSCHFIDGPSGKLTYENNTVFFWPESSLQNSTIYTFRLTKSITSLKGKSLPQDHYFSFMTKPHNAVLVLDNFIPKPPEQLNPNGYLEFDTFQYEGTERKVLIALQFGNSSWEIVWNGSAYTSEYIKSDRYKIDNGYHYKLKKSGAWPVAQLNMTYYILAE